MISKLLFFIERVAAYFLGKGWGSSTVSKEFAAAVSLLDEEKVSIFIDIGGNKGTYSYEIIKNFS